MLDHGVGEGAELGDDRPGLGGQVDQPNAAVGWIATPLDQPGFLEPVDHAAERDRLDLEQVGEAALVEALMARQGRQRAPLRARHADQARALIEASPHQARNVANQEAEGITHRCAYNKHAYIKLGLSRANGATVIARNGGWSVSA